MKRKMKPIIKMIYLCTIVLAGILVISSCQRKDEKQHNDEEFVQETMHKDIMESNKEVSDSKEGEEPLDEVAINDLEDEDKIIVKEVMDIRDITSVALVEEIIIGWNLGNSLDATGGAGLQTETSWGNPKTSKEMVDMVREAGFNIIRIPTTWEKHLGPAPNYMIDEAWLERVKEVVDYGIGNEMFVILNLHHEEWHFPSNENYDDAKDILVKVWSQIADYFSGYNEYLIFEGMNEPRMKHTSYEWNGGTKEAREVVSKLNLDFIHTIRASGGNNTNRHLMIPTYAASSDKKTWEDLIVPDDDKVIVSIHAYTPYRFALEESGSTIWSADNENDRRDIDTLFNDLNEQFIEKGIPVILGEFGARNKDNLSSRVDWAYYYIKKAKEVGIPCVWWDNGAFYESGENFGIFNRRSLVWEFPEILEALMNGVNE